MPPSWTGHNMSPSGTGPYLPPSGTERYMPHSEAVCYLPPSWPGATCRPYGHDATCLPLGQVGIYRPHGQGTTCRPLGQGSICMLPSGTLPVSDPRWHRCTHWGRIPISRARRVRGLLRGMKRGRALGTCHQTEVSGLRRIRPAFLAGAALIPAIERTLPSYCHLLGRSQSRKTLP